MKRLIPLTFCFSFFLACSSQIAPNSIPYDEPTVEDVRLPILTLRTQAKTSHCWAYAMSFMLESRVLERDSIKYITHIEQELKYWVDFERLHYMFDSKKDYNFSTTREGAWPIEYWEAFLKHGIHIYSTESVEPKITYQVGSNSFLDLGFIDYPRPARGQVDDVDVIKSKLTKEITDPEKANEYITETLEKLYGPGTTKTKWFDKEIDTINVRDIILGSDIKPEFKFSDKFSKIAMIITTTDQDFGWKRYLLDRYWGYRYDKMKILTLIETSLKNHWAIPFDNDWHAMTIIGYNKINDVTLYAVANSQLGTSTEPYSSGVTWYNGNDLLKNLSHLYVFIDAIPGLLPEKEPTLGRQDIDYDELDGFKGPPPGF